MDKLSAALYDLIKANDVSSFQENNFDINFVVNKETPGKDIVSAILKSGDLIKKVDLFDIYEDEVRLPGKRSLSFKVYIQSLTETLDDKVKNRLIEEIVKKVGKKG
jgi:phenylalanyl-tRNA synthetase beta subunit